MPRALRTACDPLCWAAAGPQSFRSLLAVSGAACLPDAAESVMPCLVSLAELQTLMRFWVGRNLDSMTQNFRVHSVDLLGNGMSGADPCGLSHAPWASPETQSHCAAVDPGRPPFRAKTRETAEAFFLDALSTWREKMGIDKVCSGTSSPLHAPCAPSSQLRPTFTACGSTACLCPW